MGARVGVVTARTTDTLSRRTAGTAGIAATSPDLDRLLDLIAGLEPVGLQAVQDTADLQTRIDKKYLIPVATLGTLVRALEPSLTVLEIDGQHAFDYESVYFDTPGLQLYRDHVQGRRHRYKVRTRHYLNSGLCLLEVKAKGGRTQTVKHRLPWTQDHSRRIVGSGLDFVDGFLRGRPEADSLIPVVTSRYRRATLVDFEHGLRITCDIDLEFDASGRGFVVPAGHVLVETKSRTGRAEPDRLLHRLGARDLSVSKYCAGIALLHGAPANRWHRTLGRYLAPVA